MLISMTGFGSKTADIVSKRGNQTAVNVEVKSLNSRFFEATCKLPSSLSHLEIEIINRLKKALIRGRVFLTIRFSGDYDGLEVLTPAYKVIEDYLVIAKNLQTKFGISGDLNIKDVMLLPHAMMIEKDSITPAQEQAILTAVDDAIVALATVRTTEGTGLGKELELIFKACKKNIKKVEQFAVALLEEQKQQIKALLESDDVGSEESRAKLEEMYVVANKIDINEEISRFNSHLSASLDLLKAKQTEKGKRFDFIIQELLRETNTITAKCSNYAISSVAVDIKVDIERVREQVQNII